MAQKRMFSALVTETDRFLEMPVGSQALYFHLGMAGDDDGFVASPKRVMRMAGCNDDDLRLLAAKNFIIPFESGVVVIIDWGVNNTLKNDRYHPTLCTVEKSALTMDEAGRYVLQTEAVPTWNQVGTILEPTWNQPGSKLEPEHNLTELNSTQLNETKKGTADKPPARPRFSPPTVEEVRAYITEKGYKVDAEAFVAFYESNGWRVGKNPMRSWHSALVTWEKREGGFNRGDGGRNSGTSARDWGVTYDN